MKFFDIAKSLLRKMEELFVLPLHCFLFYIFDFHISHAGVGPTLKKIVDAGN